ncbi:four helix bundle protein [Candidatus Gottesmanbacteria bacterium]|nr:four helix bundle protein [Candidatus Gottesmanbacteria bacterium]
MFKFEELHVYQEGLELVDLIYAVTKRWPSDERFGLIDQLRRAASSIVLNIAEGSSRSSREFRHFIDFAKGSCYECIAILTIAKNRKYISQNEYAGFYGQVEIIARMLSALKRSLPITNNQ